MSILKLTQDNYYSQKADKTYLSVSQYKDFFGTLGQKGCEAEAMAKLCGDYAEEPNTAMLIGSYVDSWFEGTLDKFKETHPDIFKKDGNLKADFIKADEIIERCKRDKKFMQFMSGEKQVIMTAKLFGVNWKIKMDSYTPHKAIVDLKVIDDIRKTYYHRDTGKLCFIQERGYDFQLAIYQRVVEMNTGELLPCYIAVADKGKVPNIELIQLTQKDLDTTLPGVSIGVERIKKLKKGEIEPYRCEECDYCKQTKVIKHPILMSSLLENNY